MIPPSSYEILPALIYDTSNFNTIRKCKDELAQS